MTEAPSASAEIPPRGKPKSPYCWLGNELVDVFLPIMGADCLAIYAYFARREFSDPKLKHSVREVADATKLGITTVSRSLEILEHLGLIKLTRFGGCKGSECQLLDSREVAARLGAEYHSRTLSFSLAPDVAYRLNTELETLRDKQQRKLSRTASRNCGNRRRAVSRRNASVSSGIHQRSTRETPAGFHLLLEERRIENIPSPTPSHDRKAENTKTFPDDDEAGQDAVLQWARAKFDGVIKDMKSHLLDTSRPPSPYLTNGFTDWQGFGFDSLAVARMSRRGATPLLVLFANDPAMAWRGLDKYRKKWGESVRKWYECEVQLELIQAEH